MDLWEKIYVSHVWLISLNPIFYVSHRFRCNILGETNINLGEMEGMGEQGSKADHNQLGKRAVS